MKIKNFGVNVIRILGILFIVVSMLYVDRAYAGDSSPNGVEKEAHSPLTRINPRYVCMINNQAFNKEQIPVKVDGKTYYGCCQMCEAKLKSDPASHIAIDPVSGKEVDKAAAVIGASPDGTVYYFESEKNPKKFLTVTRARND
jgi:YHS domain-containing protein